MLFYSLLHRYLKLSDYRFHRLLCRYKYPKNALPFNDRSIADDIKMHVFRFFINSINKKRFLFVNTRIRSFIKLKTVKGFCHLFHLPVKGQRSKTNARTQKRKGVAYKKDIKKKVKNR